MKVTAIVLSIILTFSPLLTDAYPKTQPSESYKIISNKGFLPITITSDNLDRKVTHGECVHVLVSILDYSEQYRISLSNSFWSRLWQSIRRFFRYLRFDFSNLRRYSKLDDYEKLAIAKCWGIEFESLDVNKPLKGWELLELESFGLSEVLSTAGVPRTYREEIELLKTQIGKVSNELENKYKDLFKYDKPALKSEKPWRSGQSWVYFIFASQHDLLPKWKTQITPKILDNDLSVRQALDFLWRVIPLTEQMARDLIR